MMATAWFGMFVPAKTPDAAYNRLVREGTRVMADPTVREKMVGFSIEPWTGTVAEFSAYVKEDMKLWAEDARVSGYKMD